MEIIQVMETKYGRVPSIKDSGNFKWKIRMGIHMAFHQNMANRILHLIAVNIVPWATFAMAAIMTSGGEAVNPWAVDVTLLLAMSLVLLFAAADVGAAALHALLYLVYRHHALGWAASYSDSPYLGVTFAFAMFLFGGFVIPVVIGHGIFEKGIDDSSDNFQELGRSKNPVFLTLILLYTNLEVMFDCGYKPAVRDQIGEITKTLRKHIEEK